MKEKIQKMRFSAANFPHLTKRRNTMYKAVIFDMDGTILNTIGDLTNAINYALAEMGKKHDFPEEKVKLCFGCGIDADMEKALAMEAGCPDEDLEYIGSSIPFSHYHFTKEDVQNLKSLFVPRYTAHCHEKTAPYEGIPEVLSALRKQGILTAVASNKDDRDVQTLTRALFPRLFDQAMGNHKEIRRKPAPDMVMAILKNLHVFPKEACYIGDSEVDMETARNSGIPCISVDWGFRTRSFLLAHGADCIVSSPKELLPLLMK